VGYDLEEFITTRLRGAIVIPASFCRRSGRTSTARITSRATTVIINPHREKLRVHADDCAQAACGRESRRGSRLGILLSYC
jgi:hypothetical protein